MMVVIRDMTEKEREMITKAIARFRGEGFVCGDVKVSEISRALRDYLQLRDELAQLATK